MLEQSVVSGDAFNSIFNGALDNAGGAFRSIFDELRNPLLTRYQVGSIRMRTLQVDGVECALRGADAAADASDLVYDGSSAGQAAGRLNLDLLLGEALDVLFEGLGAVNVGDELGLLTLGVVIGVNGDVVRIQRMEVTVLTAKGQGGPW